MKRHWDLVREILLAEEADKNMVFDYDDKFVNYHYKLLIEAKLIHGIIQNYEDDQFECFPYGLTWEGHEFLDSIRNENIWNNVFKKIKEYDSLTLPIITNLASEAIKKVIGL